MSTGLDQIRRIAEKYEAVIRRGEVTPERLCETVRAYMAWCLQSELPPSKIKHPSTWLNQDRWEDEGPEFASSDPDQRLRDIASVVRKPWCTRGRYPRDMLQQCVDAGLLTKDEMEAKL